MQAGLLDRYVRFRALTVELLGTLDQESLGFVPGPGLGPLWQQFRHLGRIEDNYTTALDTGRIAFGPPGRRAAGITRDALAAYLRDLDNDLRGAVANAASGLRIRWGGEEIDLPEHLARLVDHEILHQGELIAYVRLLGRRFPPGWRIWGL